MVICSKICSHSFHLSIAISNIGEAKESFNDVGYDLLTGDWGIDIKSLKTMTIVKNSAKENTYTVSYMVIGYPQSPTKPVNEHVILHVSLTKENGQLKIASIKDLTTRSI